MVSAGQAAAFQQGNWRQLWHCRRAVVGWQHILDRGGFQKCGPAKTTFSCPATGPCDDRVACDGLSPACPANPFKIAGTVCRTAVAGGCDIAETCNGTSNACPSDAVPPSGTICRVAVDQCDVVEVCSGTLATCPANGFQSDGASCNDGLICTIGDTCQGGVCKGSKQLDCNDNNPCTCS